MCCKSIFLVKISLLEIVISFPSPTFLKKSESKSHQSVTIVTSTIEYSLQVSKLDFFPPCDIKDSLLVTDKI